MAWAIRKVQSTMDATLLVPAIGIGLVILGLFAGFKWIGGKVDKIAK